MGGWRDGRLRGGKGGGMEGKEQGGKGLDR